MSGSISTITTFLLDCIFPRFCIICNTPHTDLCVSCIKKLSWPKPRPRDRRWVTSLWNYRDPQVKKLVVTLKNKPHKRLAQHIAQALCQQLANRPRHRDLWIMIPIPLSARRLRTRGFNQSILLATCISQELALMTITIPVIVDAVIKSKETKKQGTLQSKEERLENMQDSFSIVRPELLRGKNVLLIDDVTTTGTTLDSLRQLLVTSGVRHVAALTIAN